MLLASIPPIGGGGVVGCTTSVVPLPDALPASLPAGLTGACEVESEIVPVVATAETPLKPESKAH